MGARLHIIHGDIQASCSSMGPIIMGIIVSELLVAMTRIMTMVEAVLTASLCLWVLVIMIDFVTLFLSTNLIRS